MAMTCMSRFVCRFDGFDDVGGIAGGGDADQYVAGASECAHLFAEYMVETVACRWRSGRKCLSSARQRPIPCVLFQNGRSFLRRSAARRQPNRRCRRQDLPSFIRHCSISSAACTVGSTSTFRASCLARMLSAKCAETRSCNVVMRLTCNILNPFGLAVAFNQYRIQAAGRMVQPVLLQIILYTSLQFQ